MLELMKIILDGGWIIDEEVFFEALDVTGIQDVI